jgi:hypothetical protein
VATGIGVHTIVDNRNFIFVFPITVSYAAVRHLRSGEASRYRKNA